MYHRVVLCLCNFESSLIPHLHNDGDSDEVKLTNVPCFRSDTADTAGLMYIWIIFYTVDITVTFSMKNYRYSRSIVHLL